MHKITRKIIIIVLLNIATMAAVLPAIVNAGNTIFMPARPQQSTPPPASEYYGDDDIGNTFDPSMRYDGKPADLSDHSSAVLGDLAVVPPDNRAGDTVAFHTFKNVTLWKADTQDMFFDFFTHKIRVADGRITDNEYLIPRGVTMIGAELVVFDSDKNVFGCAASFRQVSFMVADSFAMPSITPWFGPPDPEFQAFIEDMGDPLIPCTSSGWMYGYYPGTEFTADQVRVITDFTVFSNR